MNLHLRIKHFLTARHYRGHGIHSPFLYDFIRTVLMKSSTKQQLLNNIHVKYNVKPVLITDLGHELEGQIMFLDSEHLTLDEFRKWRSERKYMSVWTKYGVLVFTDSRLPNQYFAIRS